MSPLDRYEYVAHECVDSPPFTEPAVYLLVRYSWCSIPLWRLTFVRLPERHYWCSAARPEYRCDPRLSLLLEDMLQIARTEPSWLDETARIPYG